MATTSPVPAPILADYLNLLANIQVAINWLEALKTAIDFDGNSGTGLLFQAVAQTESVLTSMTRAKTAMEAAYPDLLTGVGAPPPPSA